MTPPEASLGTAVTSLRWSVSGAGLQGVPGEAGDTVGTAADKGARRPDRSASRPDTSPARPDTSAGLPDTSAARPDVSAPLPDLSAGVPDTSSALPDMSAALPDISVALPGISAGPGETSGGLPATSGEDAERSSAHGGSPRPARRPGQSAGTPSRLGAGAGYEFESLWAEPSVAAAPDLEPSGLRLQPRHAQRRRVRAGPEGRLADRSAGGRTIRPPTRSTQSFRPPTHSVRLCAALPRMHRRPCRAAEAHHPRYTPVNRFRGQNLRALDLDSRG